MPPAPDAPDTAPSGDNLLSSLRVLGADAVRYLELKLRLAAIEGGEAGRQYARAFTLSAIGVVFFGAADLIVCASLISLLTDLIEPVWQGIRWEYLALVAGLIHAVAGWAILKSAKSTASQDVFTDTIDQLDKDREWLNKTTDHNS